MTVTLPDIRDLIMDTEFTLSDAQAQRINTATAVPRHTRWWIAPEGAVPPGPRTDETVADVLDPDSYTATARRLVEPWLDPWQQLNDPDSDPMVGMCVLDRDDAARGLIIMVYPTAEARHAWHLAVREEPGRLSLGCETGILVPAPAVDYRAVFRHVWPAPQVSRDAVRWHFSRPRPDVSAWDVITAGWAPDKARAAMPHPMGITG